jgi:hypothetical protein
MWAQTNLFPSLDRKSWFVLSIEALSRFWTPQNNCFYGHENWFLAKIRKEHTDSVWQLDASRNIECICSRFPEHVWIHARIGKAIRPRVQFSYVKLELKALAQLCAVSRIQQASSSEKHFLPSKACPFAIILQSTHVSCCRNFSKKEHLASIVLCKRTVNSILVIYYRPYD